MPAVAEVTRSTPYDDLPQWLSVGEAAHHLDLAPWTVYQLVHQGKVPHTRFGKTIKIPKAFFHPSNATQQVTV